MSKMNLLSLLCASFFLRSMDEEPSASNRFALLDHEVACKMLLKKEMAISSLPSVQYEAERECVVVSFKKPPSKKSIKVAQKLLDIPGIDKIFAWVHYPEDTRGKLKREVWLRFMSSGYYISFDKNNYLTAIYPWPKNIKRPPKKK